MSTSALTGTLTNFSSCSSSTGWNGDGTTAVSGAAGPYRLTFNGSNNYADFGSGVGPDLNGTSGITVAAWIYPSSAANADANIVSKLYQWYTNYNTDRTIRMGFYTGSASWVGYYSTGTAPLNTWTYVVWTYDGANMKMYLNDSLDSTHAQTGNLAYGSGLHCSVRVGAEAGGCGSPESGYFSGSTGAIEVYSRALSATEIAQNCNASKARFSGATCN